MKSTLEKLLLPVLAGFALLAATACGAKKTEAARNAGKTAPEVAIDLGESSLYTREERNDAALLIRKEFATFAGCELHSIRYAGDEANTEENVAWLNSLREARADGSPEGPEYAQVAEFLTDFHSPVEDGPYAWEIDREYTDYQWWLARPTDGGWQLVSWGY